MSRSFLPQRRCFQPILVALLLVLASLSASAQSEDFLPVSEAFQPSISRDGQTVTVHWQITEGYYLYRHALGFETGTDNAIGEPRIPDGDKHTDEFFGEVETYRERLDVEVPIADAARAPATITVTYQGCADLGLCYPPQTQLLDVPPAATGTASNIASDAGSANGAAQSSQAAAPDTAVSEQDRIAGVLDDASITWVLLSFLGLGVLLAFTPCVLPMIPILSGLIVGHGDKATAGRGFVLSTAYVLAMALAYTVFGVLAGLFGANLQALLQSPWTLVPFALVFAALSLSMFGYYELQMPSSWQTRLDRIGRGREGDIVGAAVIGFVSALIVGPCLAPPLAGALLYIGASGDAVLGGLALFALGLGMGLPLIALGTLGGGILPRSGAWMIQIKHLFGVILLGVAVWLLARILPGPLVLALWAILLLSYGVQLGALRATSVQSTAPMRLMQSAGLLLIIYAVVLVLGAASGSERPLRPLDRLALGTIGAGDSASNAALDSPFTRVADQAELDAALAAAARASRPAVVDFYADWCVECVQMEHTVFADPAVRAALDEITALQVDVTDYNAADRALLKDMGVFGPPTIVFYDVDGNEVRSQRVVGTVEAQGFIQQLQTLAGPRP